MFRESNRFSTTVHRKSTFSGVFTNYHAYIPIEYKKGLLLTLLHRAYTINSAYTSLHQEIEKLKKIFTKNGYPMRFIDKCILKFFNKLYAKKVVELTVPKKEVTVVLPFMGSTSLKLKNEIVK